MDFLVMIQKLSEDLSGFIYLFFKCLICAIVTESPQKGCYFCPLVLDTEKYTV